MFCCGIVDDIWGIEWEFGIIVGRGIFVFNDGDITKELVEIDDGSSSDLTLSSITILSLVSVGTPSKISTLGKKKKTEKKR
jgi:hypothetical protein